RGGQGIPPPAARAGGSRGARRVRREAAARSCEGSVMKTGDRSQDHSAEMTRQSPGPVPIGDYFPRELFKGKTVFVTGGGSGINLGVARNFAVLGAQIALCGRTQEKLDHDAAELRARNRH